MADDMVEVLMARNAAEAQMVVDEVLAPAGIQAAIHNRASTMIPAPATLQGGFFVAVPREQAEDAVDTLEEAHEAGALPDDIVIAELDEE